MEKKVGEITHFFAKPSAAVLKLESALKVGDQVHIQGHSTHITQEVTSMQVDRKEVGPAKPGDDVAMLVTDRVREGDEVFLVED